VYRLLLSWLFYKFVDKFWLLQSCFLLLSVQICKVSKTDIFIGATTLSITTLSIMTFIITTLSRTTLRGKYPVSRPALAEGWIRTLERRMVIVPPLPLGLNMGYPSVAAGKFEMDFQSCLTHENA
jgi:hypothetical protein